MSFDPKINSLRAFQSKKRFRGFPAEFPMTLKKPVLAHAQGQAFTCGTTLIDIKNMPALTECYHIPGRLTLAARLYYWEAPFISPSEAHSLFLTSSGSQHPGLSEDRLKAQLPLHWFKAILTIITGNVKKKCYFRGAAIHRPADNRSEPSL